MPHDISDLQKRIAALKEDTNPSLKTELSENAETPEDKQGLGAAYELIMTPLVCGGIGAGIDHLFSTGHVFFLTLAVLGVCAGFWRVYRVSQNIQTPLDLKRLQPDQKKGRNTQISEVHTENSDENSASH